MTIDLQLLIYIVVVVVNVVVVDVVVVVVVVVNIVVVVIVVVIVVVVVISTHQLYLGSSLHIFEPTLAPAALLQGLQQSQTHGVRLQSLIKVSKFQQFF